MTSVAPIRPELLASKLEKIENFELPRLFDDCIARPEVPRLLCYLQHVSQPRNYAGGLARFAADLIDASAEYLGTNAMHTAAAVRGSYSLADAIAILRELPQSARHELFGLDTELVEEAAECRDSSIAALISSYFESGDEVSSDAARRGELSSRDRSFWLRHLVTKLTPKAAADACTAAAREHLATYLKDACELPHIGLLPASRDEHGSPWYCVQIADALAGFIEKRADFQRAALAETAVTKLIAAWSAKSRRMRSSVMIVGNSRFGKTETVQLECATRPGHCRLVQTPPGNALSDLLREVAKSIGLEVGAQTNGRALAEKIDYCLRFLKLQLIFDEAQFLLPASYSRNSAPARLNWFRRTIMDQQIPALLVCTPQSYLPAKRRFVKTTGFAIEQFEERIDKTVNLPDELDESDLLAVARVHFPDLSDDYLQYVVSKTIATERNYTSDIAKIARHARDHAEENGRKRAILADINAAIADVLPMAAAPKLVARQNQRRKTSAANGAAPLLQTARKPVAALSDMLGRRGADTTIFLAEAIPEPCT